ncbi:hypothetical protein LTR91_024780 [Friedmanniomyces endolithicus]|uniref:Peroxisomal membrane protein PEX14 n=1 Tax=Friedmanniomyces endolithicus TaxID=329885 RepID=A0AAN6H170_9PEZI|nr:hypothetical protein LTR75_004503 [Friedmanniomyces endolithicus]KAK0850101.1 hypothetical protein LTR03_004815 [Friedmanniomyces endolithicus]KAK0866057.1 hypothetical protein LTS02_004977 [Friedmanniomyces endolithicus]KAK0905213.1 hypothetical protein LTR02_006597 [Friedmanniomyces endolithicus]KAK0918081.1 hypothetical protein LTR57_012078 [Friedmanniomyces endolithicus]
MSNGSTKRSIPSWQQQAKLASSESVRGSGNDAPVVEEAAAVSSTSNDEADSEESPPPESSDPQLDMVEAFLADPRVKHESVGKKRAFLQSKEIAVDTIDQVLKAGKPAASPFDTSDFQAFKQRRQQQQQQPPPQPSATTAPIITYPEFLVSAHTPSPLVTPSRVVNAAYLAGGIATLVYGASTFLFKPMTETLTSARHDFAAHSQGKLDDFNERLAKIVSNIPSTDVAASVPELEINETDSVVSDPTELYHRDMGTQTSPLPSRRPSDPFLPPTSEHTTHDKDPTTHQTTILTSLSTHMNDLLAGLTTHQAAANKDRTAEKDKLRHFLDSMLYGGSHAVYDASGGGWSQGGDSWKYGKKDEEGGANKAMEELKKEIRGVKGVLLSARRFPGVVGGRVGAGP